MRRISLWLLSTVAALVLLFSYRSEEIATSLALLTLRQDASERSSIESQIPLQLLILLKKLHKLRTIHRALSSVKLLKHLRQLLSLLIASTYKIRSSIQAVTDM